MAADTIPARLLRRAEQMPGRTAYLEKVDGEYVPTSWGEYADQVRQAGKSLIALGFQPGQITTRDEELGNSANSTAGAGQGGNDAR